MEDETKEGENKSEGTEQVADFVATEEDEEKPQELGEIGRNKDGTFKEGHAKIPGSGRPKDSLKAYMRTKLSEMTPEEKEKFLADIPKDLQWRMAEGNPTSDDKLNTTIKVVIADETDDITDDNTKGQPQI